MLLCATTLVLTLATRVYSPTLVTRPAWVAQLRPALIGLGFRGRALAQLEGQWLDEPPPDATAALMGALARLEQRGIGPAALKEMLTRQPRLLPELLVGGEEVVESTLSALAEVGLEEPLALLLEQPLVLTLGGERVHQASRYLEGYIGSAGRVADFALLHPQSLLWVPDEATPAAQHLRALGLPDALIKRAGRGFPQLYKLKERSADNLEQTIRFLRGDEVRLAEPALHRLVGRHPQLLGLSFEHNVRPTVGFLRDECGVDVGAVLQRHPPLLGLSLEANLRPTVAYLRDELGVDVGRAVSRHPPLLSLSVDEKLRPTVAYLRDEAGLCAATLGRAVTQQPALLSLSVETNLRPKVAWLRTLRMPNLAAQLDASPSLLTLSLDDNLRPSVEALRAAGLVADADDADADDDADDATAENADADATAGAATADDEGQEGQEGEGEGWVEPPTKLRLRHLAASLDGRIRPRLAYAAALQQRVDVTGRLSLHSVCTASDDAFCEALGTPCAAYTEYRARHRAEAAPSSSQQQQQQQQALAVSWLPPSLDLAALVFAEGEGERQLHEAMRAQQLLVEEEQEARQREEGEAQERRRQAEQRRRERDERARAQKKAEKAEKAEAARAEARRREATPDEKARRGGRTDGQVDFALELPE